MNTPAGTLIFSAPSRLSGAALARALEGQGISCRMAGELSEGAFHFTREGGQVLRIPCPARLGQVTERLQIFLQSAAPAQSLTFGPYTLDLIGKIWQAQGQDPVTLTDREAGLLAALIKAPGHSLSRAEILSAVWEYHQEAETHTLETHIYRLRRKIERDAVKPEILLTEGAGYKLCE